KRRKVMEKLRMADSKPSIRQRRWLGLGGLALLTMSTAELEAQVVPSHADRIFVNAKIWTGEGH
ncbi:MAG TPA: hypothetical protein VNS63_20020, partial [Blastocatellia bacterium]|nr:hypothetical protein [Blastocatellia bacterium]